MHVLQHTTGRRSVPLDLDKIAQAGALAEDLRRAWSLQRIIREARRKYLSQV